MLAAGGEVDPVSLFRCEMVHALHALRFSIIGSYVEDLYTEPFCEGDQSSLGSI